MCVHARMHACMCPPPLDCNPQALHACTASRLLLPAPSLLPPRRVTTKQTEWCVFLSPPRYLHTRTACSIAIGTDVFVPASVPCRRLGPATCGMPFRGTRVQGRPVYIQLVGQINIKEVMASTTEERMFKYHVQEYERCVKVILPICSRLQRRQLDQTFGIMDVRGALPAAALVTMMPCGRQPPPAPCSGHIHLSHHPSMWM